MDADKIEKLASDLRQTAFPGARSWLHCASDTRERWINVATHAVSLIDRAVDNVLRDATAKAHGVGEHEAAKMLRDMRSQRDTD